MSENKIANRYAQALMQQAIADNKVKAVADDMQSILDTIQSDVNLSNMLQNPIINKQAKLKALLAIFKNSTNLTNGILQLVCSKNRENVLQNIAENFVQLYRQHQGIQFVTVESASTLEQNTLDDIEQFIKSKTGAKEIQMATKVNPEIVGGLIIKYGDNLVDSSIAAKIRNLKKELKIA